MATVDTEQLVQVGFLIDGQEFVPMDIARAHMPFAVPRPGPKVEAVFVLPEED